MTESEQRFVEIIERIPVIEEKLDKLLLALDKIATNNNLIGINIGGDIPFEYSETKEAEDTIKKNNYHELNEKARKLKEEADAISDELGFESTGNS